MSPLLQELTFTLDREGDYAAHLYMGSWPEPVASYRRHKKMWSAHIWLPGCRPRKAYASLEDQMADVNAQVRAFYEAAVTWPEK